jgi:hypothetical protein
MINLTLGIGVLGDDLGWTEPALSFLVAAALIGRTPAARPLVAISLYIMSDLNVINL